MRKQYRSIVVAVAAATLLVTAGCSSTPTDPGDGDASGTITLLMADPQENVQPALDAFAAAYPDITVEYEYVPFDQFNNLIEQRVGGGDDSVDVYAVDSGAVGTLASKGYLVDLTEDFGDRVAADSLPATAAANTFDDKLWSAPLWTSMQYLYYNKALLDAAGVAYPSQDIAEAATYQQLLEDGKAIQASGATWGFLFDQTSRYYQLQPLMESVGGGSGVTGDDLLTADIDNAGWVSAMEWYSELFESGVAPRGIATEQMGPLFASGAAAYIVGGPWLIAGLMEEGVVDYGIAANPIWEGGTPAMSTGSWNLGINPATDNLEASKVLIEFLTLTPEGNTAAAIAQGTSPALSASFDEFAAGLDARDGERTAGLGELTTALLNNTAVNRPNSPGFTLLADVTGRAFEDIRNGLDVTTTLDTAQSELQGLWDRLR